MALIRKENCRTKIPRGKKTSSRNFGPTFHAADADFQPRPRTNFPTQPVFDTDRGHETLESGNRLSRDVHGTTAYDQSYTYDGLHRLTQTDQGNWNGSTITGKNFEEDYALDQLGNWENLPRTDGTSTTLDQDRTHNAANETGTIDVWQTPAHDAAGNMTTIPQPKAPANGYAATYDAWNRLIKLNSGSDIQINEYDGLHRRIVRDETGGSGDKRHFYYNEKWQCMEERVEVGGTIDPDPIKQYVYFPFYIDAVASVLFDPDTDGVGITRYDYLHDANFNVVALVTGTTSFDVVERYHYSPYGEVTILNGASDLNDMGGDWSVDADQVSDIGNEYLYTGQRLDPETGIYYYKNRYYHAQLGRFINRDPIGYLGGMNLYGYVGGMPTRYVDPLGLDYDFETAESLGRDEYGRPITRDKYGLYWVNDHGRNPIEDALGKPPELIVLPGGVENHPWREGTDLRSRADSAPALGRTTPSIDVNCGCVCDEKTQQWRIFNCAVKVDFLIEIDPELHKQKQRSIESTYGHEQRHILNTTYLIERAVEQEWNKNEEDFRKAALNARFVNEGALKWTPIIGPRASDS